MIKLGGATLIRIIGVNETPDIVVPLQDNSKRIVVLFPMTRGLKANIARWQKLISTLRISDVTALVLIDKTFNFEATEYFSSQIDLIECQVYILQRSLLEPIHDSQKHVRLCEGLWIIQLHDDDDWDGALKLPSNVSVNEVVKTRFALSRNGEDMELKDLRIPDCRSIFSMLPAGVWNHFTNLIELQGGHVAGSIDSSLNLAVNCMLPSHYQKEFVYLYDDSNWNLRRKSTEHLIKLTEQDGWGEFTSVDMSLVSRVIDGISAIIFFNPFYPNIDYDSQIRDWISRTKPKRVKILLKRLKICIMVFMQNYFKVLIQNASKVLNSRLQLSLISDEIILKTWQAKEIAHYIEVTHLLQKNVTDHKLQQRFSFWLAELNRTKRTVK